MSLDALLKRRIIEQIPVDRQLVRNTFELAARDIRTADTNAKAGHYDWAYAIAYNAILQAGRSLMFSRGYRSAGPNRHVSVMEFLSASGAAPEPVLFLLNASRKKRHRVVYEQVDLVTKESAEEAIQLAREFMETVRKAVGT